jgi:heme oxygenase
MIQGLFLKRLKQATNERHRALEGQLPLLDSRLSREHYRQFVSRFFGYYEPLEARLLSLACWDEIGFDYAERRKTPRLEQDLIALGETPDALTWVPRCQDLPEVVTIPHLLGCLYVIEGATLGGQIISRRLQTNLGLTPESGASFFNGYGAQTGPRWQAFGTTLTTLAQRTGGEEDIIDSANKTFATIDEWLFPKSTTRAPYP